MTSLSPLSAHTTEIHLEMRRGIPNHRPADRCQSILPTRTRKTLQATLALLAFQLPRSVLDPSRQEHPPSFPPSCRLPPRPLPPPPRFALHQVAGYPADAGPSFAAVPSETTATA